MGKQLNEGTEPRSLTGLGATVTNSRRLRSIFLRCPIAISRVLQEKTLLRLKLGAFQV